MNAASSMAPGLPSGGIARGSVFSIYGRNLGPDTSPGLSFPLQTNLGGVTITLTQGDTTVNAIPVFVGPGQINAILPSNAPLGLSSLRVTYNNRTGNRMPVRVVNSSFGIYTATGTGLGPGIFQNASTTGQPVNSLKTVAQPGDVIILWGTGLGPITAADNLAPPTTSLPTKTEVFVGGKQAQITYNGRSGCCAGTDQIVFAVPNDAPTGCWVPVAVRTEGAVVSNFATMAIGADPAQCAEPDNPLAKALIAGGTTAMFAPTRFHVRSDIAVPAPLETSADFAGGFVARETAGVFNFNPAFSLPPAGACTAYTAAGNFPLDQDLLPGMLPTGGALDAGATQITGAKGSHNLPASAYAGLLASYLGGMIPGVPQLPAGLVLDPGAVSVSTGGGADAGAIQAQATMPEPFTWTNRDQNTEVIRSQGLTLTWNGVAPGNTVFIVGGNADLPNNATGLFLCRAQPGDTSFTVPAAALANVPASRRLATQSLGAVYVGQWQLTSPAPVNAQGVNFGLLIPTQMQGKSVRFH